MKDLILIYVCPEHERDIYRMDRRENYTILVVAGEVVHRGSETLDKRLDAFLPHVEEIRHRAWSDVVSGTNSVCELLAGGLSTGIFGKPDPKNAMELIWCVSEGVFQQPRVRKIRMDEILDEVEKIRPSSGQTVTGAQILPET